VLLRSSTSLFWDQPHFALLRIYERRDGALLHRYLRRRRKPTQRRAPGGSIRLRLAETAARDANAKGYAIAMIAYTVTCELDDPAVAEGWIAWLLTKHVRDVCDAGALEATVIRLDGPPSPVVLEVRYRFVSREAFAAYERDHAPRLRAE